MVKELFDLKYMIDSSRERLLFYLFVLSYVLLSFNLIPSDIPLALALFLFTICPVPGCFFMFSFYTIFENVSLFSFGLTLNLIFQILLFIKVFLYIKNNHIKIGKVFWYKKAYLIYWMICGIITFFIYLSPTSFANVFRMSIVFFAIPYLSNREITNKFWHVIFQILTFSVLLSVIYGIFNETSLERDLIGGSEFSQMYGTLGTTRLGMFLVIALVYPLYYVNNKTLRILLVILLTILSLMTVSLTAFASLFIVFGLYFISFGKIKKLLISIVLFFCVFTVTFNFWSQISFIQPIVDRIEVAMFFYDSGQYNKLTSGRENLSELYLNKFNNRSGMEKMTGDFSPTALDKTIDKYSHNTYLDMLNCNGLIGLILFISYNLFNILFYLKFKDKKILYPILSAKFVLLIAAFTVSIYTNIYWTWFLFL